VSINLKIYRFHSTQPKVTVPNVEGFFSFQRG